MFNKFECDFVGVVNKFWRLLRHSKIKNFSLFICLNQIITPMKLILYYRFAVFPSQTLRIGLLSLLRIHRTNKFLPLKNRIALTTFSINQNHHTTLSTHHIPHNIFEIWFILMFVEEIDDFLSKQFALKHILND